MTVRIALAAAKSGQKSSAHRRRLAAAIVLAPAIMFFSDGALADEGGVSFWVPGFFGSLAATPQQPGWSLATIYYHTSVSAGADVARAREFTLGRVPTNVTLNANLNLNVKATGDLGFVIPSYVFETPVLGGQASVSLIGAYGVVGTSLAGTLSGVVTAPPFGSIPFARSDTISDTTWGFGDLIPQFALRWNAGVHNYMTYITGDIPVGAYQSTRLSNIGIGHGAIDAGGGYTYFNPQTGHEFSTPAAATLISIRRPAMSFRACSASPIISRTLRRSIRTASTCTSTGVHRSSSRSRSWLGSWATSTKNSAATAVQATVSAASSPRWLASVHKSGSYFRSATCRAIST
ncbi:hypothetical protein ACVL91_007931 [Bradyrhizobium elkanii]